MGFLDKNGMNYLWNKIKNKFVEKVDGKGLSTNDYTAEDKEKLDGLQSSLDAKADVEHNHSADDVGALPLTGGKLGGQLQFQYHSNNGYASLYKNHDANSDYGLTMLDIDGDGKYVALGLCAKENRVAFMDKSGINHLIYGGHNITNGTTDIGAGSALATGCIHLVYE